MIDLAEGWSLTIDEGPEWLFFRLSQLTDEHDLAPPLAKVVWQHAEHRGRRRLVFELDHHTLLSSYLIGQLVLLHKRAEIEGGVFRLCDFSEYAHQALARMGMASRFPNYRSREEAVMGHLPNA